MMNPEQLEAMGVASIEQGAQLRVQGHPLAAEFTAVGLGVIIEAERARVIRRERDETRTDFRFWE
jgi:hypothetical protein